MPAGLRALMRLFSKTPSKRRPSSVRPWLESLEDRLVPSADFVQTNLVSDIAGLAQTFDANLINAWGLTLSPTSSFWVANQGSGTSTLYNGQGQPQPPGNNPPFTPLIVSIPANPADNPLPAHGSPTGDVFNTSGTGFNVSEDGGTPGSSIFLFATTDGTISGWSPGVDPTHAIIGATNPGAVFTGLAIGKDSNGDTLLYAADFAHNTIDVYDSSFTLVTTLAGDFTDPNLPANFRVFNVQAINNQLYVEYAPFDPATGGVLPGTGNGRVDVYNTDGQLQQQLISGGKLDDPWGIALAPANFGAFSNDLLVGNFGSGNINAFDPTTGKFLGELKTSSGQPFNVEHLWSLQFGNGAGTGAGSQDTLFFTAGLTSHFGAGTGTPHGLFGSLQAVPQVAPNTSITLNLDDFPKQTITTVAASNGDVSPHGVAFVPQNFQGGGKLAPGDLLVSNFNDNQNVQGNGSTIVLITPDGQHSTFFQGEPGLGLTTALGVLPQGFILVGSAPATTAADGTNTVGDGSILILDSNGNQVGEISDPTLLQGPWDLTINNVDKTHAQVFVSNVLSGTVTRIDLSIPNGGTPQVDNETQIASGFAHRTDANALVVGPTGLAFDSKTGTLLVASTGDNAIYAIPNADTTSEDAGRGKAVVQDPDHLHGPLGLVLAPNGDLIVANGDAQNPPGPGQVQNALVEYTKKGQFVGQFQLDPGDPGAGFGLAAQQIGDQVRFAAVDDNTNTLQVWTFQTTGHSSGGGHHHSDGSTGSSQASSSSGGGNVSAIDAFFQSFNALVKSLESDLTAMDPQLSMSFQTVNTMLASLESTITGEPTDKLLSEL
jgi:uncharacterized protein (TIGR03118 family)